jgi:hypothetical protein
VTTAFQPDFFQSNSFQIEGGVAATSFDVSISLIQDSDTVTLDINLPSSGAGRPKRRRERYIARYKEQEYQFDTVEQLELFLEEIKKSQISVPKKVRAPVKINLSPDYIEEIPVEIQIPRRLDAMPVGVAMSQIRKIDSTLAKLLADAQRMADEQDEEECLMCIL